MLSNSQNYGKPWMLDKKKIRNEIDKLATKIMMEEALKIITKAYVAVFEAKGTKKSMEKEHQDNKDIVCHVAKIEKAVRKRLHH